MLKLGQTICMVFVVATWSDVLEAATLNVPGAYTTIQGAIDQAVAGDTVIVAPGTYHENIDFLGKDIMVKSSDGPGVTTISASFTGSVVTFQNHEPETAELDGFTLTEGAGTDLGYSGLCGGGVLVMEGAEPLIVNNIIAGNTARKGAGLLVKGAYNSNSPLILNNEISNNTAEDGGGVYISHMDPVEVRGNLISDNEAVRGGGVFCGYELLLIESVVTLNHADYGAGIYNASHLDCIDSEVSFNEAVEDGGGIYHDQGWFLMTGTLIEGNAARNAGGLFLGGSPIQQDIKFNTFKDNTASELGGGLYLDSCYHNMESCTFQGNKAQKGGGAYCYDTTYFYFFNCTFTDNTANYGGGAFTTDEDVPITEDPDFINCVFYQNRATEGGGAIGSMDDCYTVVANSILWDNEAPLGKEIYLGNLLDVTRIDVENCDVEGGLASTHAEPGCNVKWLGGNIDVDPQFADPANNDFHILAGSPCIDVGINKPWPDKDFEGDYRIIEGKTAWVVDMGVDEYNPGGSNAIYVPDDYPTIQEAIDAVTEDYTIIVRPGTYVENLLIQKTLTLKSEKGPHETVIDGNQEEACVYTRGYNKCPVLDGFTLTNGIGHLTWFEASRQTLWIRFGGGLASLYASPIIKNSIVVNNTVDGTGLYEAHGGGMCFVYSLNYPKSSNNTKRGDVCPILINNIISNNTIIDGIGAGISFRTYTYPILTNCTIMDNEGGGCAVKVVMSGSMTNCIVRGTYNPLETYQPFDVTYSNIQGGYGGTGNINKDPLFKNAAGGDYSLTYESPCVDSGSNSAPSLPETDLLGHDRMTDGNADGEGVADMGAYEFRTLDADADVISARIGGTVNFALDVGSRNGGRLYALLGTISGTEPGMPLPGGLVTLPLNWDLYTDIIWANMNTPFFLNFLNNLDGAGTASAQFNLPELHPGLAGSTMVYVFCANKPFDVVSNPVSVQIVE